MFLLYEQKIIHYNTSGGPEKKLVKRFAKKISFESLFSCVEGSKKIYFGRSEIFIEGTFTTNFIEAAIVWLLRKEKESVLFKNGSVITLNEITGILPDRFSLDKDVSEIREKESEEIHNTHICSPGSPPSSSNVIPDSTFSSSQFMTTHILPFMGIGI